MSLRSMSSALAVALAVFATGASIHARADVFNVQTTGGDVSSPTPGKWYDVVVVKGPGKLTYGSVQANGQGVVGVANIEVDGVVVSSVTFDGANVHPRPHNDPTQEVYDAAAAGTAVIGQYTPPEALAFKSDVTVRMRITPGSAIPTTFGAEVQTGDYPQ